MVFLGSFGVITIAIIGIMGCIPIKKNNTDSTVGTPTQEPGGQTTKGIRACRAFGTWITNLYNVACFANPQWPCWKTILMKALIMFVTTLGSALASLAITRLLADDKEDFEDTIAKVVNYVLGDNENRSKRDTANTEGKLTTKEMTSVVTASVICAAWTIASVTVLITYVIRQKKEATRQIERGEDDEQGGSNRIAISRPSSDSILSPTSKNSLPPPPTSVSPPSSLPDQAPHVIEDDKPEVTVYDGNGNVVMYINQDVMGLP